METVSLRLLSFCTKCICSGSDREAEGMKLYNGICTRTAQNGPALWSLARAHMFSRSLLIKQDVQTEVSPLGQAERSFLL